MTGGKTKITKRKSPTKKTKKPVEKKNDLKELKKMVRSEETLMKSELNYFKGLSITITVLIVCVFFAFGSLFTAMYLETRVMNSMVVEYINADGDFDSQDYDIIDSDVVEDLDEVAPIEWLSFELRGVEVSFPNSWTYLDKPYQKELHFYADGIVREPGNGDMGDMYLQVLNKADADEVMASDRVVSKPQSLMVDGDYLAEKVMYKSDNNLSEFVLIKTDNPDVFYRIMFSSVDSLKIMEDVLKKLDIK
jgi:hypothetical protein